MTSRHILSLQSVMHCLYRPYTGTEFNFSGLIIRYKLVPPELGLCQIVKLTTTIWVSRKFCAVDQAIT